MIFCENIEVEVLKTFIIIAHYNLNNFTTNMSIYHRKLLLKIMKIKIIKKNELIFEKWISIHFVNVKVDQERDTSPNPLVQVSHNKTMN